MPWPASTKPPRAPRERWTIAFFLGNDLTPHQVPMPNDPAITVVRIDEHLTAALAYHGNNSNDARLIDALNRQTACRIDDRVVWAQYDGPFVLPFAKKNEAQVLVKRA